MSDAEPRRSVRSTKGQHKSLDQLDLPPAPVPAAATHPRASPSATSTAATTSAAPSADAGNSKKRGRKSGSAKKFADEPEDDTEEEIIRCVCGATEQDGDPDEPWIACDTCTAWQHNVCMGMSRFTEDLPKHYYCEKCRPENHTELLEGMARGEKPWETFRHQYEEEKANEKKRKSSRKVKGKRNSDARDHKEGSAKPSPTPESRRDSKGPVGTKRKTRADSEDQEGKKRKLSETKSLPVYKAPVDLPKYISDLVETRQTPAKGLSRAITEVLGSLQRRGEFTPAEDATLESTSERFAIQIERAVHDAHPTGKEYGAQIRTLRFNLKENHELCARLVQGSLIPPMLATMSSDQLASRELQQKTAKMKAQAERQSILDTEDAGAPRLRRTHKGEEVVERGGSTGIVEDKPAVLRRPGVREDASGESGSSSRRAALQGRGANLRVETKTEKSEKGDGLSKKNFDLKRVFSSVRSPTSASAHQRRPSQAHLPLDGPGHDPDIDRMLQDDDENESPPYSPTEDFWEEDPDVVWRGEIEMTNVSGFHATARHVGGVNLNATIGLPWTTLLPKKLTVAGRIDERLATEYLCSLRYSAPTDISVASLSPGTEAAKSDFLTLIDYFTQRHRYGVIGERSADNVRDTYLVPLPAGTSTHPEFMLNLEDNFIPTSRTAPMLLLVVVYRNDPADMERLLGPNWAAQHNAPNVGTPGPAGTIDGASDTNGGTAPAATQRTASLESPPGQATGNGIGNGTANGTTLASGSRNAALPSPVATGFSPIAPQGQQTPAALSGAMSTTPPVGAPSAPALAAAAQAQVQAQAQVALPPAPAPAAAPQAATVPRSQQQPTPPAVQPLQPLQAQPSQSSQVLQPPQPIASRPVPFPILPQQQQQRKAQQLQIQPPQPHVQVAGTPPPLMHPQPVPSVPVASINMASQQQQQQQMQHQLQLQQQHQQQQQLLQHQQHQQHLMQQQHLQQHPQHLSPGISHAAAAAAAQREQAQRDGEAIAREILGPLATCSAAGYLMTQAAKMQRNEWLLVRSVFEQQPQTRDDLQLLKHELERYNERHVHTQHAQQQTQQHAQQKAQQHAHQQAQQAQHTQHIQHAQHHALQHSAAAQAAPKQQMQTPVPIPRVPVQPAASGASPSAAGNSVPRAVAHPAAGATPGSKPVSR